MNSARFRIPLAGLLFAVLAGFALLVAQSSAARGGNTAAAARAIAKAQAATRGGLPYDIESERRANRAVWEVKVATGGGATELHLSANGRRVVNRHRLARPGAEARWVRSAKVSLAKALRIANRRTSGRFDEAELDRERGRLVWSVSFGAGGAEVEVEVDAANGRVVGVDRD